VTANLSLQILLKTSNDAIGQVTQEDCKGFCHHVESLEKQYWEMYGIVPDVIYSIVINLSTDSDNEGSTSSGEDSS
jgi:hypothetical protein